MFHHYSMVSPRLTNCDYEKSDVPESKWWLDTKSILEGSRDSGRRLSCLLRRKGKGGSSEEGEGSNSLHRDIFLE